MDYLDFEVSVDARADGEYEVSARAPSGEARARVRFPFTPEQLTTQLQLVQRVMEQTRAAREVVPVETNGSADRGRREIQQFGQTLFQSLLTGKVLVAWRASGALAEKDGRGLRLQLRLQAPEMAALPWELMYDPDDACFVCLNPSTPLVRYPELDRAPEQLTVTLPLRVLGMIASPSNLPQLDKAAERSRIERALKRLRQDGLVELTWMEGGTYRDLQAAMRAGPWHVFHFIGHGGFEGEGESGGGVLALETTSSMAVPAADTGDLPVGPGGPTGPAHLVSANLVAQLLRGHSSLRLVLLNSCLGARASSADVFSSTASTLVRRGIPAVVAMQNEITDRAAVTFAQAFYTSLAAGTAVEGAVADARAAISAVRPDSIEWGTPVLLMRSSSGVLFAPAATAAVPGVVSAANAAVEAPARARQRVAPALLVGLVSVPLAVAAALAAIRAPGVELALDADVSRVAVTLPRAQSLAEPLEVASLGVSGLVSVDLPPPGAGGIETDRVLLSASSDSGAAGRLALDLGPRLPPGTQVTLGASREPGTYQLWLGDSIPDLTIAALGRVTIVVPGERNDSVEYTAPAVIRLRADRGTVALEFRPAAGARATLADKLPADGLDLIRVDRFESPSGTEHREVSTLLGGSLALDGGSARPLAAGDELRAGGVRGQLTRLELAGDHVALAVRGRADRLTIGSGAALRDLVPSLFSSLLARHTLGLVVVGVLYAASAAAIFLRWGRTTA